MNKIVIALVVIVLVGIGAYFLIQNKSNYTAEPTVQNTPTITTPTTTIAELPVVEAPKVDETKTIIGSSVEGRNIMAYHFGTGEKEILFIGGIHGGYEWNTSLVAYELMSYLEKASSTIPSNVRVTVIPVLNPDGLNKIVGTDGLFVKADVPSGASATIPGRFNAHNVDLNRNFDCDWQTEGKWQDTNVSGGSKAFSEPESQAIKAYVEARDLAGIVVWYSAAGGVFASNCHNDVPKETLVLTNLFAKASGYKAYESFDFYAITGDMVNWFAKKNIPAISVLLTTHEDTEWTKNLAGVTALLKHYAQ